MIAHFHVRAPDAFGGYPPRRSAAVRATVRTFCPREEHPMRRQVVAWAAIILLGSSVATAHAQGYDKEPVVGFLARFTIRSPYGLFEAHGQRMLPIRVNEVEALSALDNVSRSREFTAAAGRAIAR